jgi:hypothetical protein
MWTWRLLQCTKYLLCKQKSPCLHLLRCAACVPECGANAACVADVCTCNSGFSGDGFTCGLDCDLALLGPNATTRWQCTLVNGKAKSGTVCRMKPTLCSYAVSPPQVQCLNGAFTTDVPADCTAGTKRMFWLLTRYSICTLTHHVKQKRMAWQRSRHSLSLSEHAAHAYIPVCESAPSTCTKLPGSATQCGDIYVRFGVMFQYQQDMQPNCTNMCVSAPPARCISDLTRSGLWRALTAYC